MNKDEKIKDIRKDFVSPCIKGSDRCGKIDCHHCHATALYNAGYRKIADDEIVLNKEDYDKLCHLAYFGYEDVKQETAREVLQKVKDILQGDYNIPLPLAQLYQENGIYYGGKI